MVVVGTRARRSLPGRRAARRVRAVLGGVLLVVGSATAVPALFAGSAAVADAAGDEVPAGTGRVAAVLLVLTVCGIGCGRALLRVPRRTVLWLRRFRDDDGVRALAATLGHIGRSWRVVTLDDARTAPVGVPAGLRVPARTLRAVGRFAGGAVRVAAAVARPLTTACVVGLVLTVGWTVLGDRPFAVLDALSAGPTDWSGPPATDVARVLLAVLLLEGALLVGYLVVMLTATVLFGLVHLVGSSTDAVLAAEAVKTGQVHHGQHLDEVTAAVGRTGRGVVAPRLFVLTVAGTLWQRAVERLARACDVVLVDVSRSSDNLLWEIGLVQELGRPLVLVGRLDRVPALADPQQADPSGDAARLRALLDGRRVLACGDGFVARRRFERALWATLEDAVPRRPLTGRQVARHVVTLVGLGLFAVAAAEAVALLGRWL